MAELITFAGERKLLDFTLTYSADWSDVSKQGDPIVEADVSAAYFYLKRNKTDATAILMLSTALDTEIDWITGGTILRVKLGTNTLSLAGVFVYELRLKLSDGSFVSADSGVLTIAESVTGNPA